MIIDSSALVGIFLREPEADRLLEAIGDAPTTAISAANLVETGIVLSHRLGKPMHHGLELFLAKLNVAVVPFDAGHANEAIRAWWKYGRTRSPARLNFGDCIAYAAAKIAEEPLLCKGDDFPQTDLALADY